MVGTPAVRRARGGVLVLAATIACSGDHGFRFRAEYGAPRSGYHIKLISQGWVESGDDVSENAFALVRFCPTSTPGPREFAVTLTSAPVTPTVITSSDLGLPPTEMKFGRAEGILADLLSRAGYASLDSGEVRRTNGVMQNALRGPKGVTLEGQVDSLQVLSTKTEYGYPVMKDQPRESWITSPDVPRC